MSRSGNAIVKAFNWEGTDKVRIRHNSLCKVERKFVMIDKNQFLAYLMFLADEYGNSYSVFLQFTREEGYENLVTVDEVTYNLLNEARDGLPEDIRHPENDGFIYVNSIADRMDMDCVEWQMGDFENNDRIKYLLLEKYRHKVSREGLDELFKELTSYEGYEFKDFLIVEGLVK